MKLLIDANISYRLSQFLNDIFEEVVHVDKLISSSAQDQQIWDYAKDNNFIIVAKDSDFHQRSLVFGAPPKTVWVRKGNCSTIAIAQLIRDRYDDLAAFYDDNNAAILLLD